jgi:tartrate-resistant acid phosphatase type 5
VSVGGQGREDRAWSRRRFLQQTAKFSALALLEAPFATKAEVAVARPAQGSTHLLMLGDWGTSGYPREQLAVAEGMRRWVTGNNIRPEALLMLGDNFYGEMPGGVSSPRWIRQFEQMYPVSIFPGPAYAVLGNHDYESFRGNKVQAELAYSRRSGRWTMPHRWYRVELPENDPILTLICLDSNIPGSKGLDLSPWSFVLTRKEHREQQLWLENELAKPRSTPFLAVAAHHPLFTNGKHGDNHALIAEWDSLLRRYNVDLYLSGHDHDLQHLEFKGHPTSFVVSGGGGAHLTDWTTAPQQRGPWGARAQGFTHLELTRSQCTLRHVGKEGRVLYEFNKQRSSPVSA